MKQAEARQKLTDLIAPSKRPFVPICGESGHGETGWQAWPYGAASWPPASRLAPPLVGRASPQPSKAYSPCTNRQ
jgi:hypothetical protein